MTTKNKMKIFTLWVSISLNLMINIETLRISSRSLDLKFNDSSSIELHKWSVNISMNYRVTNF